jgi:hypothetical protein
MKITQLQETPHPVFEAEVTSKRDIWALADWLMERDRPEDMSISLDGCMFTFRTRVEACQFALGLTKALGFVNVFEARELGISA